MVISGLVLQCDPAQAEGAFPQVNALPGISDLALIDDQGHMVCVLETEGREGSARIVDRLLQVPGIHSVMPTYIHALEEDEGWNSPAVHS